MQNVRVGNAYFFAFQDRMNTLICIRSWIGRGPCYKGLLGILPLLSWPRQFHVFAILQIIRIPISLSFANIWDERCMNVESSWITCSRSVRKFVLVAHLECYERSNPKYHQNRPHRCCNCSLKRKSAAIQRGKGHFIQSGSTGVLYAAGHVFPRGSRTLSQCPIRPFSEAPSFQFKTTLKLNPIIGLSSKHLSSFSGRDV